MVKKAPDLDSQQRIKVFLSQNTVNKLSETRSWMFIPDPDFLILDPDPGVKKAVSRIRIHLIRIRIQHFRLITNPDQGY
jgi:hypothetical protein